MNIKWIIGMLLVLMLVACAPQEAPPEETEPVDEAPVEEAPVEEEAPADEGAEAPDLGLDESKDNSGLDPAVVANWKKACLAGNAGLCAALERYGIDPNEGAEAADVEAPAEE